MSDDIEMATKALERARQRLGATQGKAKPPYNEAADARGSAQQASLVTVRNSHDSLGSILKRWESALPTIGPALQAAEASSSTGRQLGATGAVVRLSDRRQTGRRTSTASSETRSTLTHEQIAKMLLELNALTKHRAEAPDEMRLRLSAYRERLALMPATAVTKALKGWPDCHDWWPTWAELKREIEEWM